VALWEDHPEPKRLLEREEALLESFLFIMQLAPTMPSSPRMQIIS
jgi:hypothetical protein